MKNRMAMILLSLALLGGAAACGGIDEDGTVDLLVENGVPEEAARCIVDAAVDDLPTDVLTGDEDATPEQEARLQEITLDCLSAS